MTKRILPIVVHLHPFELFYFMVWLMGPIELQNLLSARVYDLILKLSNAVLAFTDKKVENLTGIETHKIAICFAGTFKKSNLACFVDLLFTYH